MTAWRRVQRSQDSCVPGQLLWYPPPQKLDVLLLDGKHVSFRKRPWTLYVALDGHTRRPLAWILLPRTETREGYDLLLTHLRAEGCQIASVVSDGHRSIAAAVDDHLPRAMHQRCAAHVLMAVLKRLGGKRLLATRGGRTVWPHIRAIALNHAFLTGAFHALLTLARTSPALLPGLRVLARALPALYAFAAREDLAIPRTSNGIENFMGFLEQRLKTMRGMKTPETYITFITERIILKFKRPTNL